MKTFEQLYRELNWEEIPNCPGRYRLLNGAQQVSPEELVGESAVAFRGESDRCRDPFVVVELPEGGALLSYERLDGSFVHTLNTASGLKRKLDDLGVRVLGEEGEVGRLNEVGRAGEDSPP